MDSEAIRMSPALTKTCCGALRSAAVHIFRAEYVIEGARERQHGNDTWTVGAQCRLPATARVHLPVHPFIPQLGFGQFGEPLALVRA